MPNVRAVQDSGESAALIFLEGDSKGIWTPDRVAAMALMGKPIPADWLRKPNKQGTGDVLLPPKKGGGGGGYRQSKEAFESEAKSRSAWQVVEEEKKDRRTALMQAVTIAERDDPGGIVVIAELFYDWLRETSGSVAAEGPHAPGLDPGPDTTLAPSVRASTPASDGEAVAGTAPEGQTNPSGVTKTYPVDPSTCDHKMPSGRWIRWDADDKCPKCGTTKLLAMET